jgi:hypothetical protein
MRSFQRRAVRALVILALVVVAAYILSYGHH